MFFTKKDSMPDIYLDVLYFCPGYKPTSALAAQTYGFKWSFFVEQSDSGEKGVAAWKRMLPGIHNTSLLF